MGMRIRKKRGDKQREGRTKEVREGYVEVGHGEHCVMTLNRHDGSVVVQRFATEEEAAAQYRRNVERDAPLVGVTEQN